MKKYLPFAISLFLFPSIAAMKCNYTTPGPGAGKPNPNNVTIHDCYPNGSPDVCVPIFACAAVVWTDSGQTPYSGWIAAPDQTTAENCLKDDNYTAVQCELNHIESPESCGSVSITFEIDCSNDSTGQYNETCSSGKIVSDLCDDSQKEIAKSTCSWIGDPSWTCEFAVWSCQ